ncbi:MAG: M23 family metallopeptidase [Candidatus Berkelbacteria bacterium]
MNPQVIKYIAVAFSMKNEIKTLIFTIIAICLLPIFTVLLLTQAGIDAVSGVLVSRNPQTAQVDIHDPETGEVIDHVDSKIMWPVSGPVSLEFGEIDLPYQPIHTGIDIASWTHEVGDPVVAFMDGTVTYSDAMSWGFGRHVKLDNGHFVTSIYGHLDTLNVAVGDHVKAGDTIGTRGTTGWSTGPHLHFQINVFGIPVNPRVFLDGNP